MFCPIRFFFAFFVRSKIYIFLQGVLKKSAQWSFQYYIFFLEVVQQNFVVGGGSNFLFLFY